MEKILINETEINGTGFIEELLDGRRLIGFDFQVTNSSYHDITVLLYKNDFEVRVPDKNLMFQATIHNYFTSFTNLYEEGAVGDFHLELIEKQS